VAPSSRNARIIVTVTGSDHPGIVAAVSRGHACLMGVRSPSTLGCLAMSPLVVVMSVGPMRTLALRTARRGGPKCAAVVCGRERRVVGYCARHPEPHADRGLCLTP
jgi:hypothetical protein